MASSPDLTGLGPRREWLRLLGWRLVFGVGVLVAWEIATARWVDPFWFSSPLRIVTHLVQWTREGTLFGHLIVTLRETFLGLSGPSSGSSWPPPVGWAT